jgi:sugar lactone lactonase YvrE
VTSPGGEANDSYGFGFADFPATTADMVYGQNGSFISNGSLPVSSKSLGRPTSVAVDSVGGVYIVDPGSYRVLHYPKNSIAPDRVYGQSSFDVASVQIDPFSGQPKEDALIRPTAVAVDARDGIYVAISTEGGLAGKVLYYPPGKTVPTRVYSSFSVGTITSRLNEPNSVAVDPDDGIYVSDRGSHRVLHFPAGSTTPDRVYGQGGNFASVASNCVDPVTVGGAAQCRAQYPTAATLFSPNSVAIDRVSGIYVADTGNNRVLHYSARNTTADRVLLQTNFTSTNMVGSCAGPVSVATDTADGLYTVCRDEHSVKYFSTWTGYPPNNNGLNLGSFTESLAPVSARNLRRPVSVALDEAGVYVADESNNRVLRFSFVKP